MTKGEIEARIAEIKAKIERNNFLIDTYDTRQYCLKIVINSAYGAVSSRQNPMGSDDLANAITMMGSHSIQQVNEIGYDVIKEYAIREAKKRIEEDEGKRAEMETLIRNLENDPNFVKQAHVFNDTDSMGISLSLIPVEMFRKRKGEIAVTKAGYALVKEVCDEINDRFRKWYSDVTNSDNCRLIFKREKICDIGIWLMKGGKDLDGAKKNYVVRVIDNEDVKHFDGKYIKYTGVKFAKSVIPKPLKEAAKKVVETMLDSQEQEATDKSLRELWETYKNMEMNDKAAIQKANIIERYARVAASEAVRGPLGVVDELDGEPEEAPEAALGSFVKGTPGHVKAALNYNTLIELLGIKRLLPIESGDTYKIVPVKPNKWGFETMGYLEEWPEEFNEHLEIDNVTGFNKAVYTELKRFYKTVGWDAFNPSDNYELSLLDILKM